MYNKKQPLTKETKMYNSLRSNEFELTHAIAEIIDNSIEAGATDIQIYINKVTEKNIMVVDDIFIVDNGCGMNIEQIQKCLTLGESQRKHISKTDRKIGKFGVGLTLGGTSIARRVDVISRNNDKFYRTYICLDEIENEEMKYIPDVEECNDYLEYKEVLGHGTGTLVRLSNCDRVNMNPITNRIRNCVNIHHDLKEFLGRVYRYFLESGLNISINGEKIDSFDPLFVYNYDVITEKEYEKGKLEKRDIDKTVVLLHTKKEFEYELGKKANVEIMLTLLPEKYREYIGAGNNSTAKALRIDKNEAISILRCNREVLYGKVPYLIGEQGQYKGYELDRFWGLEISFPPELDDFFHVRFIKRGAEPINDLKAFIRTVITPKVKYARKEIRRVYKLEKQNSANNVTDSIANILGIEKSDNNKMTTEEFDSEIDNFFDAGFKNYDCSKSIRKHLNENKDVIELNLLKYKFSISFEKLPSDKLFVFDDFGSYRIIVVNTNHPYVQKVIFRSALFNDESLNNVKYFESQIAALISPLLVIDTENFDVDKKVFTKTYSKILCDSVVVENNKIK